MALFTDQNVSDISDLIAYEANLPEIAGAEGIDLATKVKLAQTEVAAELEAATQRPGNVYFTEGSGWQSSGGETNLSRIDLHNIVVTPPLKLWHTFQTLSIAYRDAYNRKLNDKYLPKWKEYKELARWAADLLFQTGIGITTTPIPRTPLPTLDWVSSTLGGMAVFARATWVGANSSEGAGSVEQAISVPTGNALRVTPPNAPSGVTGWNVYVGARRVARPPGKTLSRWIWARRGRCRDRDWSLESCSGADRIRRYSRRCPGSCRAGEELSGSGRAIRGVLEPGGGESGWLIFVWRL